MSEENVELVRRGYEAFNRRDFDAALAIADDSITWRPLISVETDFLEGKEEIRAAWTSAAESLDVHVEVEELIPVGDASVVAVATWTGHGSASGTPVGATAAQVFTIEDGVVLTVESYAGKAEALKAAGLSE
jgi:ketosteroid isomerase-like protein